MVHLSEHNITVFLIQIFFLLGLARAGGELFRRWHQPAFTAEILTGILLGPTVLGRFSPGLHQILFPVDAVQQNMLETVSWLGILFLLLVIGLEVDFSSAWRQRGEALTIAVTDIVIPMALSFTACLFLPEGYLMEPGRRIMFALFMATAMTISAMPIAARALHDLKLSKTDLGFLIVSALSVNDIIGWLIFTVVLGVFTQSHFSTVKIAVSLASTMGFAVFCMTVGSRWVNEALLKFKARQMPEPGTSLTLICLLGIFGGAVTQSVGIHALFGFFIAGIMAGQAKALSERTRQVISQMVFAVFVPLFFAGIGLKVDFLKNFDFFLVLFISSLSIAGKFLGAWLGAALTKISRDNRLPVAIAHIPGGSMEILIGLVAFEHHLITVQVFVALVFGAVISSVIFGPWLSWAIKHRREISILEYFSRRTIAAALRANTRDRAVRELCEAVGEAEDLPDASALCAAVLRREEVLGTALEEAVAVPHARPVSLRRPVIAFGRSAAGIEWNSPDGKPARFIFLILTPQREDDIQVQILASISKVMSVEETRRALAQARDDHEVWVILRQAFTLHHIKRR